MRITLAKMALRLLAEPRIPDSTKRTIIKTTMRIGQILDKVKVKV